MNKPHPNDNSFQENEPHQTSNHEKQRKNLLPPNHKNPQKDQKVFTFNSTQPESLKQMNFGDLIKQQNQHFDVKLPFSPNSKAKSSSKSKASSTIFTPTTTTFTKSNEFEYFFKAPPPSNF